MEVTIGTLKQTFCTEVSMNLIMESVGTTKGMLGPYLGLFTLTWARVNPVLDIRHFELIINLLSGGSGEPECNLC